MNAAFEQLMQSLSAEDKAKISAAGMAFGLDFQSPEWIPFAISQHGLLEIQKATKEIAKVFENGLDSARVQIVESTINGSNKIGDAVAANVEALTKFAASLQEEIGQAAAQKIAAEVKLTFSNSPELKAAKSNFIEIVNTASNRVSKIAVGKFLTMVLSSFVAGVVGAMTFFIVLNLGNYSVTPQADSKTIAENVIQILRNQNLVTKKPTVGKGQK